MIVSDRSVGAPVEGSTAKAATLVFAAPLMATNEEASAVALSGSAHSPSSAVLILRQAAAATGGCARQRPQKLRPEPAASKERSASATRVPLGFPRPRRAGAWKASLALALRPATETLTLTSPKPGGAKTSTARRKPVPRGSRATDETFVARPPMTTAVAPGPGAKPLPEMRTRVPPAVLTGAPATSAATAVIRGAG